MAMLYRGKGEYKKSWQTWEKLGDKEDNTMVFGKYITLFTHMMNLENESFGTLYATYNNMTGLDDKIKYIKRFNYAGKDLKIMLNRTFLVIFSGALLFPAKSYRLFLLPEFLHFLQKNNLSNNDWNNMILFIQNESNIQEVFDESINSSAIKSSLREHSITNNTILIICLKRFAQLINHQRQLYFIPSEIDNDFQANLNYCFALINYYLLIAPERNTQDMAKTKARALKYLAMAEHHANQSLFIFSEKKQADVPKKEFLDEIKYLKNAVNKV